MRDIFDWLKYSNRWKHIIGGVIWSFFYTLLACALTKNIWASFWLSAVSTFGVGSALEFKDWQYASNPDPVDDGMTTLGGLIGGLVAVGLVYIIN